MDIKEVCVIVLFFKFVFSFLKKVERKEVYNLISTFWKRWRLEEKYYIKNREKRYEERESVCVLFS